MSKKAVILLSGGIDSSTTATVAKAEGYELYALSFDYNQRHKIELESAKKVAESLGAKKHLVIKFDLREIGGSALLDNREMGRRGDPGIRGCGDTETRKHGDAGTKDFTDSPSLRFTASCIPVTYVPARNTIFLSFALGWAEVLEAEDIFIGANAVDYSGYPDCRPEYLKAFENMANLATRVSVEGKMRFKINAPLLYMTKAEIIKKGAELGLDYSLTWSCYDPQKASRHGDSETRRLGDAEMRESPDVVTASPLRRVGVSDLVPCQKCDSCLFRAKGFREAGIKDPLI